MPKHSLLPDPMPLRDALRGLRFALQRGGETLISVLPVEALPPPAQRVAGAVLRDAGQLAQGVGDVAADLARLALGGDGPAPSLAEAGPEAADTFARSFYAALRAVLGRLHALPAHVSELAARQAFLSCPPDGAGDGAARAAALSRALRQGRVLRGVTIHPDTRLPEPQLESLAVFAVMLCLQAERHEGDEDELLTAATDLALALAEEVPAAFDAADPAPLAALYRTFAAHV